MKGFEKFCLQIKFDIGQERGVKGVLPKGALVSMSPKTNFISDIATRKYIEDDINVIL